MLLTQTSNDLSKFLESLSEKIKTSALEELLLKFWKNGQMKKKNLVKYFSHRKTNKEKGTDTFLSRWSLLWLIFHTFI